jgi:methylmalonyl-CoA mutase, N-terminal domain
VVVGVNRFVTDEDYTPKTLEIGVGVERKQIERLRRLKSERDNRKVGQTLDRVRTVARSSENIMPVMIDAVRSYATLGEISDALRQVFGEYREPNIL